MKKRAITLLLLTMVVFAGCGSKDLFAQWEEDWAAFEQASSKAVSEEESEDVIPEELMDAGSVTKYNAEEQGLIRPYELQQAEHDSPHVDWAYAAFKVIEAGLIKQGDANKDTIDLSEGNYIYYAVNTEEDFLANQEEDIFYLSSAYGMNVTDPFYKGINGYSNLFIGMDGKGIVSETDAPFDESNKEKITSSIGGLAIGESEGRIKRENSDWIITGYSRIEPTDIAQAKELLLEKGALQIDYEFSLLGYHDGAYHTKYFGGNAIRSGVIIGWDDSYARTNFKESMRPENDGAWLVYDCMGAKLGSDGYIWVSYENPAIASLYSYDVVPRSRYGKVFSYTAIGYNQGIKADGEEYTTVANIYENPEDELITAVGIFAYSPGQQVEVEIYTNVFDANPTSGTLASSMSITADNCGYAVYDLENTVSLNGGEAFSVVLKYGNDGTDEWGGEFGIVPVEGPAFDFEMDVQYNFYFTSAKGQSYGMRNGEWYDLSEESSAEQFGESEVLNNVFMKVLTKKKG